MSAKTGYNLARLVETMIFALPPEASSGVFRQVREEHRTTEAESTARQDFGDLLGELFSRIVDAIPLPKAVR
ncbi:GTP-binding protein, partial [Klebsiella pneumoniae]